MKKIGILYFGIMVSLCSFAVWTAIWLGNKFFPTEKVITLSPLSVSARYDFSKADYAMRQYTGVRVTAYTNVHAQTDGTPNITASGRGVYEGAIAVSQDFIKSKEIRYGDLLCIKGRDCYIVEDCLHERFKRQVDIFTFDAKKASNTHFKADIEVYGVVR